MPFTYSRIHVFHPTICTNTEYMYNILQLIVAIKKGERNGWIHNLDNLFSFVRSAHIYDSITFYIFFLCPRVFAYGCCVQAHSVSTLKPFGAKVVCVLVCTCRSINLVNNSFRLNISAISIAPDRISISQFVNIEIGFFRRGI